MTAGPDGAVIITTAQMYGELREIGRKVDGIDAKLDALVRDHGDQLDDHESRLRSLEARVWRAAGASAVLAAVATAGASLVIR